MTRPRISTAIFACIVEFCRAPPCAAAATISRVGLVTGNAEIPQVSSVAARTDAIAGGAGGRAEPHPASRSAQAAAVFMGRFCRGPRHSQPATLCEVPLAVHGHRGARAVLPENTLAGFEYAIRAGADYLELDVLATRDNVLVVSHDPVLSRLRCVSPGGSRVVSELTLAELRRWDCGSRRNRRFPRQVPVPGARIPTLDEVLELARHPHIQFDVEVKSFPQRPWLAPPPRRFAQLVLDAVERHRLQSRVVVQSFDFQVLRELNRLAPHLRLAALYEFGARDLVSLAREAGASIAAPYHRLATPRRVAAAHDAGLRVVPWTANRPRAWERLMRAGVDGIITDDPAALIDFLRVRGLR